MLLFAGLIRVRGWGQNCSLALMVQDLSYPSKHRILCLGVNTVYSYLLIHQLVCNIFFFNKANATLVHLRVCLQKGSWGFHLGDNDIFAYVVRMRNFEKNVKIG